METTMGLVKEPFTDRTHFTIGKIDKSNNQILVHLAQFCLHQSILYPFYLFIFFNSQYKFTQFMKQV